MTIYQIKRLSATTAPYFFTRETLRFFGQSMRSFRVYAQPDGRFKITAPMKNSRGEIMGETVRYFNPITNQLEIN